jgi:hypothetical protein
MAQPDDHILDRAGERDLAEGEASDERFDRTEFALRALDLVRPPRTIVAVCEGARRMRVERGRRWGRQGESWAMLAVPRHASRRAIALAVAELFDVPRAWVLDVLVGRTHESVQ